MGPLSSPEKKTASLLVIMMVLWIAGSWIEFLDVLTVGLGGAIVMFLPGMRLLTWKQAERAIGWDTLLMIGGVTSLGTASVEAGLAAWLVELALGGVASWHIIGILLAISAFTVVIHLALPIGPVVNAVVIPPIALLAINAGVNPALYALPVAFTASCAFLLPLDAVPLLTYSRGYYPMHEMLVPGALISAVWVVWMTVVMLVVGTRPRVRLVSRLRRDTSRPFDQGVDHENTDHHDDGVGCARIRRAGAGSTVWRRRIVRRHPQPRELKAQTFHVSAGRRLKPDSWPEGNRVAVALSFDVDNATATLSRGNLNSEVISRGEYGAVDGLPRILRMLERAGGAGVVLHPGPSAIYCTQAWSSRSSPPVSTRSACTAGFTNCCPFSMMPPRSSVSSTRRSTR